VLLLISNKGETLPLVYRLRKEGIPAEIYVHDLGHGRNYAGILPRVGLGDLQNAIKRAEVIAIDTIQRNQKNARDLAFLSKFNISPNVPDLFGRFGDKHRQTHLVIGGGEQVAEYELDRAKGVELAKKAGFAIPPYQDFKSLKQAARFLHSSEGRKRERWYFKADGNLDLDLTFDGTPEQLIDYLVHKIPKRLGTDAVNCILQEAVDGDVVELSREGWRGLDGKLTNPNSTLENKRLHSRDSGPRVGCAVSTVWRDKNFEGVGHKQIQAAANYFSGYVGAVDVNFILTNDLSPWFLEWTCRFGYSALYLLLTFILKGKIGNFFLNPFQTVWQDGFAASQVLSLYPFPPTANNRTDFLQMIEGNLINEPVDKKGMWWLDVYQDGMDNFRVGGSDGLVGVAVAHAETMEEAIHKAYHLVESIKITGNKQFWPHDEHLKAHQDRYKKLQKWGVV